MPEGDVVGAGGGELFGMNQPGADQPIWISLLIDIVTVGCGELPARCARARVGQRRHVGVIDMGVTPDFQLKLVKYGRILDVQPQDTDIGNQPEPARR